MQVLATPGEAFAEAAAPTIAEPVIVVAPRHRGQVSAWLAMVCVLVVMMLVIGGITRLTGSGLSIVEWRPVTGTLPPLSDAAWREAFEAYQTSPQYRLVNAGMSLADFQRIYFWEYVHRLLGRLLGVAFFVPCAWFAVKKALPRPLIQRLAVGFALGGLQGLMGWIMVKSGLKDEPHVSHYRLAAHLSLALVTLGLLYWTWLDLRGRGVATPRPLRIALRVLLGLLCLQIVYGAFTAGLRAGIGYNTFPTMYGAWVPDEALAMSPMWRNALESRAGIQLLHRLFGTLLVVAAGVVAYLARRAPPPVRGALAWVLVLVLVQYGLGVATLLLLVPISVAAIHQLGACVVLLATLRALHRAAA